ncbi:TetR/AcrR family transcriptional regulator [Paracoccus sp. p3-h83]|uniref:TetR/AcrR family transcriptional regulator n=1 Tax=Paracoccus sp. p3-h83 TaxID=3342805 RepID=UPI0035BB3BEF
MSFPKVVKGRKFQQVLEGARKVFLRDGFDGASVDDIAREASVSKATLYSYFPEKRLMLIEVARAEFEQLANSAHEDVDLTLPTPDLLRAVAYLVATNIASDFSIQVFRLAVAESPRFPAIGHEYLRAGPGLLNDRLSMLMTLLVQRGDLAIDDLDLAVEQFMELCSVKLHDLAQFGQRDQVTPQMIDRVVDGAVRLFLAGYGAARA